MADWPDYIDRLARSPCGNQADLSLMEMKVKSMALLKMRVSSPLLRDITNDMGTRQGVPPVARDYLRFFPCLGGVWCLVGGSAGLVCTEVTAVPALDVEPVTVTVGEPPAVGVAAAAAGDAAGAL